MSDGRVVVAGVGGGGGRALAHLHTHWRETPELAVVHTSEAFLRASPISRQLLIGASQTGGLSTGGDPEIGRRAAEESADALKELWAGVELAVVVAGLGGGTGGGAAPVVARIARESGALTLAVCTLPFFFEGVGRRQRAEESLRALRAATDAVIVFPNQRLFEWVGADAPIPRAFAVVDEVVAAGLRSLWRLMTQRWLLEVDFADLRRLAHAGERQLALAAFEAGGPNRVPETLAHLRESPLLDRGDALAAARGLIIAAIVGPDLTLSEFDRLVNGITERVHPDADLRIGAAIDPEYEGRVGITLLLAEQPPAPAAEAAAEAAPAGDAAPAEESAAAAPADAAASTASPRAPTGRQRRGRGAVKPVQGTLAIEPTGKGRFKDTAPTILDGEDLDIPTFIRRGLKLGQLG